MAFRRCIQHLGRVKSSATTNNAHSSKTNILLLALSRTLTPLENKSSSPFPFGYSYRFSSSSPSAPMMPSERFGFRGSQYDGITCFGQNWVADETSEEIKGLAQFAVNHHNKKKNTKLEFVRVVRATGLVVAGSRYFLTFEAMDGGKLKKFKADVVVQPWLHRQRLVKWEPIDDASFTCGIKQAEEEAKKLK